MPRREADMRTGAPQFEPTRGTGRVKEEILQQLENLVRKMKMHSRDFSDVDFRIFPPHTPGSPYIIEISKGRYVRRVPVDTLTTRRIALGQPDPALILSLRGAMLAVARLARNRK